MAHLEMYLALQCAMRVYVIISTFHVLIYSEHIIILNLYCNKTFYQVSQLKLLCQRIKHNISVSIIKQSIFQHRMQRD